MVAGLFVTAAGRLGQDAWDAFVNDGSKARLETGAREGRVLWSIILFYERFSSMT